MSSTIYMRESNSQSYWVNVYYGPEWLITPCRVKHFLRIKGLKPARGQSATLIAINLAVVEVFMRVEKLPYRVDTDAAAEQGDILP